MLWLLFPSFLTEEVEEWIQDKSKKQLKNQSLWKLLCSTSKCRSIHTMKHAANDVLVELTNMRQIHSRGPSPDIVKRPRALYASKRVPALSTVAKIARLLLRRFLPSLHVSKQKSANYLTTPHPRHPSSHIYDN